MDRRDFLKLTAALPAVVALPEIADARPVLTLANFKSAFAAVRQGQESDWYCIIHPTQERDLRNLAARERWRCAYRDWRKDGRPEMAYQAILDKYRPIHIWDVDVGEIGSYSNVRFITSDLSI